MHKVPMDSNADAIFLLHRAGSREQGAEGRGQRAEGRGQSEFWQIELKSGPHLRSLASIGGYHPSVHSRPPVSIFDKSN